MRRLASKSLVVTWQTIYWGRGRLGSCAAVQGIETASSLAVPDEGCWNFKAGAGIGSHFRFRVGGGGAGSSQVGHTGLSTPDPGVMVVSYLGPIRGPWLLDQCSSDEMDLCPRQGIDSWIHKAGQ